MYNNFILLLSIFLSSCSTYDYPSHNEVSSAFKNYSAETIVSKMDNVKKCPEECSQEINNLYNKVSRYYNINKKLYLSKLRIYGANSLPNGEIIINSDLVNNESNSLLSALLCHELSHSSYGHSYQKAFNNKIEKRLNIHVSVYKQSGFGVGNLIMEKIREKYLPLEDDDFEKKQALKGLLVYISTLVPLEVLDLVDMETLTNPLTPSTTGAPFGGNDEEYKTDKEKRLYRIYEKPLTYLGGEIFSFENEVQADLDTKRCLTALNLDYSHLSQLLRKILAKEQAHLSKIKTNDIKKRINYIEENK